MWERLECRIESTQEWVPEANRDPLDEDAIRAIGLGPSGVLLFEYADWGPPQSWNNQKTENARVYVQENLIDVRTLVADLPPNHWALAPGFTPTNRFYFELWTPPEGVEDNYFVERVAEMFWLDYIIDKGLYWGVRAVFD